MSNGDNRDNNGVTVSTQLIAASIAMISLIGAFAVFIIDKREVNHWYYSFTILSFLCFITSIFLGGTGISGKGKNKTPNPYYNWQAKTALLGIIFFCISFFLPKQKTDEIEKRITEQQDSITKLKTIDSLRAVDIQKLKDKIDTLTKIIYESRLTTNTSKQGVAAKKTKNGKNLPISNNNEKK